MKQSKNVLRPLQGKMIYNHLFSRCLSVYLGMHKNTKLSLADSMYDLRSRKIKSTFSNQINDLLDWRVIKKVIEKHYTKEKNNFVVTKDRKDEQEVEVTKKYCSGVNKEVKSVYLRRIFTVFSF